MPDLLVKLYDLADPASRVSALRERNITVRRAMPYERYPVLSWVRERFGEGWAGECAAAFASPPARCFVAVREGAILGFACFDCTCPDFFGPTGVDENERGRGIGAALLLSALHAMAASGYAYAIIGGAGATALYEKVAGAVPIAGSVPGIYRDGLKPADRGGPRR